jgi:hypothetical protein
VERVGSEDRGQITTIRLDALFLTSVVLLLVSNYSGQMRGNSVSRKAAKAAKKRVYSQEPFAFLAVLSEKNAVFWFFFRS